MEVSLYVICHFPPIGFNILYLSLIFVSLITVCLGVFLLGFILPGTLCASWTWLTISFPMFGKFSTTISSNIFSGPFCLSSHSGSPIMWMLVHLMLSKIHGVTKRWTRQTVQFSSVQLLSRGRLCNPMNCSTPGLHVHRHLLEFTQTHVHWVRDAIQPSHPRSSPSPPAPNPSQH